MLENSSIDSKDTNSGTEIQTFIYPKQFSACFILHNK